MTGLKLTVPGLTGSLTLGQLVQGVMGEVIDADGKMQILQRAAWRQAAGNVVMEGLDRLMSLGLEELRIRFCLERRRLSWPVRIWRVLTERLGRGWLLRVARWVSSPPVLSLADHCRPEDSTQFHVEAVIGRTRKGWESWYEPNMLDRDEVDNVRVPRTAT